MREFLVRSQFAAAGLSPCIVPGAQSLSNSVSGGQVVPGLKDRQRAKLGRGLARAKKRGAPRGAPLKKWLADASNLYSFSSTK
jgi:hypothetical protein